MDYRVIKTKGEISPELVQLYENSFPVIERVPLESLLSGPEGTCSQLVSVLDGSAVVGMYCAIYNQKMTFLFYLAVSRERRGQGIGSGILSHIKSSYPHPIILNIELTTDDMESTDDRVKRRQFYLNNDFKDSNRILHDEQGSFNILSDGLIDEPEYIRLIDSLGGEPCRISSKL